MTLLVTSLFGLFVRELKRMEQDRGGRSVGLRRRLDEGTQPFDIGDDGLARGFENVALLLETGNGAANGFRCRSDNFRQGGAAQFQGYGHRLASLFTIGLGEFQ